MNKFLFVLLFVLAISAPSQAGVKNHALYKLAKVPVSVSTYKKMAYFIVAGAEAVDDGALVAGTVVQKAVTYTHVPLEKAEAFLKH